MKKFLVVVLCTMAMFISSSTFAAISVNFPGVLSVTGKLGAPGYEYDGWLNTNSQPDSWGTTYNLQDDKGQVTGAVLAMWASAFGDQQTFVNTEFPMESKMLETGIGTATSSDPATFRVTNIPYNQYDVVIYFGARNTFDSVEQVTVNGQSLFGRIAAMTGFTEMGWRQIPATSTTDQMGSTPYGNYMVFKGVVGSTLEVTAAPGWYSGVDPRACISGFQIIPVYKSFIGVNFPGVVPVSGNVGAPGYAQNNWLNTVNQPDSWGTTYTLKDDANTITDAVLSVWSSAFGVQDTFVNYVDFPMPSCLLEAGLGSWTATDPPQFKVTSVPFDTYDVVVYFGARLPYQFVQEIKVNGVSKFGRVPVYTGYTEMGYRQIPDTSVSDLQASTPYGNYVVFKNVTGSTLEVSALPGWYSGNDPRAYISAFQIVGSKITPKKSMAVNFPGTLSISGRLGAPCYGQDYWLNVANQPDSWGSMYPLKDSSNADTGAILSYWASAFGSQETFVTDSFPMPSKMLETGIGTASDSDPATFTVTNIPYAAYDAIIYFGSRHSLFEYVQKVTVNGQVQYGRVPILTGYTEMGYRMIPSTSTTDLQNQTPYGNYMIFSGVTGDTLTCTAVPGWYEDVDPRAYISGFQIVEAQSGCNGGPRPAGDLNQDCKVNFQDLEMITGDWLLQVDQVQGIRAECAANELIYAPQSAAIICDGSFADWSAASDWVTFGKWYEGGNTSTTRAKYAWNDSANKLYIAIETNEPTLPIVEIGGLTGETSVVNTLPSGGVQATQIELSNFAGGTATITNQSEGVTTGIQVGYAQSGSIKRIEIATPIYSDWKNASSAMNLAADMDVYEYVDMFKAGWASGDQQCVKDTYYYSYGSPVIMTGSMIRLIHNSPRSCSDVPLMYRSHIADLDKNCNVSLGDIAVIAKDWLVQ